MSTAEVAGALAEGAENRAWAYDSLRRRAHLMAGKHAVPRGTFSSYGQGLPGSGSVVPVLTGTGAAAGAEPESVGLTRGLGGSTAIFAFSFAPSSIPMRGGTLLVSPTSLVTVFARLSGPDGAAGAGACSVPLPIPGLPAKTSIFIQAGVLDAGAPDGVAFTNELMYSP